MAGSRVDGKSRRRARRKRPACKSLGRGPSRARFGKAPQALITKSIKDSEEILRSAAPDAVDTDGLNESVSSLSTAYLSSPPQPMLEQGLELDMN